MRETYSEEVGCSGDVWGGRVPTRPEFSGCPRWWTTLVTTSDVWWSARTRRTRDRTWTRGSGASVWGLPCLPEVKDTFERSMGIQGHSLCSSGYPSTGDSRSRTSSSRPLSCVVNLCFHPGTLVLDLRSLVPPRTSFPVDPGDPSLSVSRPTVEHGRRIGPPLLRRRFLKSQWCLPVGLHPQKGVPSKTLLKSFCWRW